jgi:hypothetical protein
VPALGFFPDFLGHSVRAENDDRAVRNLVEFLHKDGTFLAQGIHDMPAVHNLMAHINRGAVGRKREIHDFNGAIDAGAEAAGFSEIDFHSGLIPRQF